ncbi:MAG: BatA domain-containing protein, partial [Chloroflexi bacterium]|nr:BatA domain-containing protein [Chloroflexota bacterium]
MIFLAPAAFALLLVAVPIVLMYVLRLRRQERLVSSTLLWRRSLEDVQANAPWQRLRPTLLLLL